MRLVRSSTMQGRLVVCVPGLRLERRVLAMRNGLVMFALLKTLRVLLSVKSVTLVDRLLLSLPVFQQL